MIRLHVVVEGETEENFVRRILKPYLWRNHEIDANAILVPFNSGARRRAFRGGITSYAAPRRIIRRKILEDTGAYTTTMFDYYGLPDEFPGIGDNKCPPSRPERVDYIENQIAQEIGSQRFIPYLQVHEFEALLFSDAETLDETISVLGPGSRLAQMQRIVANFDTPEDINNDPDTAPSKRLEHHYAGYQKVPFGELVAESISLENIRAECPRFDAWMTKLEGLDPRA
jgi:hypothetical protein